MAAPLWKGDPRVERILQLIARLARGEVNETEETSPAQDELDAIIEGLNIVSEEWARHDHEIGSERQARMLLHDTHDHLIKRASEYRELAEVDGLTGVLSRQAFHRLLNQRLKRSSDVARAIVYIDLAGFKAINDTFGHTVGDEVLGQAGGRLRRAIRRGDLVGRLGGDEFAALVELPEPGEALRLAAERLRGAVAGDYETSAGTVNLGASVGTAPWTEGQSAEAVLSAADLAMYADKASGSRGRA